MLGAILCVMSQKKELESGMKNSKTVDLEPSTIMGGVKVSIKYTIHEGV